jgi:hypothetical protein
MRAHQHGQQSLLHWFRANAYELNEFTGTPCYITDNNEPWNMPAAAVAVAGAGAGAGTIESAASAMYVSYGSAHRTRLLVRVG